MAKLFKDSVISSETISLVNHEIAEPLTTAPESMDAPSLMDELQIKALQDEAYQQGYLAGKTDEKTQMNEQIISLKQEFETALVGIPQAVAKNRLDLNSEIAHIVLLITQQFFIEKEANPHSLELQINHLLNQLNSKETLELYLHPQEIDILQKGLIQLDATRLNGLKIKADESLGLGGYVIKTEHGIFDASIEKQIDKLKDLLLELRQRSSHATLD